jgi:hypothetical protein
MPVTLDKPAPYAPARLVLDIVTRYREKGLPAPINEEVLRRIGVTDSLMSRTIQALQGLDLVDDKGAPTAIFDSLKLAPEPEYKNRLAQWLNATYADILKYVDPGTSGQSEITDAFRYYNPAGMRDRMVSLFMALYAEAGIGQTKARTKSARATKPNGAQSPKRSPQKFEQSDQLTQTSSEMPTADIDRSHESTIRPTSPHGKQSFEHLLLSKYPEFNPAWDDTLKTKWFEGFEKFMALMGPK